MTVLTTQFKRPQMEAIYRLYLSPQRPVNRDGLQTAFQAGLAGHRARYDFTSLAYAAWAAGRDLRKAHEKLE